MCSRGLKSPAPASFLSLQLGPFSNNLSCYPVIGWLICLFFPHGDNTMDSWLFLQDKKCWMWLWPHIAPCPSLPVEPVPREAELLGLHRVLSYPFLSGESFLGISRVENSRDGSCLPLWFSSKSFHPNGLLQGAVLAMGRAMLSVGHSWPMAIRTLLLGGVAFHSWQEKGLEV